MIPPTSDKDPFVAKLGRRFEEVYLLEQMSLVSIPLSDMHELMTLGKTQYATQFGHAIHFDKALRKLMGEGLVAYRRNKYYVLTVVGKYYVRENGILKRAIQSMKKENTNFAPE